MTLDILVECLALVTVAIGHLGLAVYLAAMFLDK